LNAAFLVSYSVSYDGFTSGHFDRNISRNPSNPAKGIAIAAACVVNSSINARFWGATSITFRIAGFMETFAPRTADSTPLTKKTLKSINVDSSFNE